MNYPCFDDVLLLPKFSDIKSRKDVDTTSKFLDLEFRLPIISSNMDTVTGPRMARAMSENGALGCLHRFCTIQDNVAMFYESVFEGRGPMVSLGLGDYELGRAVALAAAGATHFCIDVAHGANMEVVKQTKALRALLGSNAKIVVGNFVNRSSIVTFLEKCGRETTVDAFKVGIGGGAACTTRVVTGVGMPTLASIIHSYDPRYKIIADGGIRNSGDFCKALAAGASAVMAGRMFAGADEAPGEIGPTSETEFCKVYRGSASASSYKTQGKEASWRAPEGASYRVPCTGPVSNVLRELEGGLRSSMSYLNAHNLHEFERNASFIEVSSACQRENGAHGAR